MKKLIVTFVALLSVCAVALAQKAETETVQTDNFQQDSMFLVNRFAKNWEFGIMVGGQAYLAEYQRLFSRGSFNPKDWWMPGFDAYIQKWASPVFGIGVGLNVAGYTGIYQNGDERTTYRLSTDPVYKSYYPGETKEYHQAKGAYLNLFAKANFDITNLFWGYNPKRVFDWTGYLGGGVILPVSKVQYYAVGATFNAGLDFWFRIAQRWRIGFSVRGALISDDFNGIDYTVSGDINNIPLDGMIGATIGVSHKFGYVQRKTFNGEWMPESVVSAESAAKAVAEAEAAKDAEIEKIVDNNNAIVKDLQNRNKELSQQLTIKPAPKKYWAHVDFKIDRWEIRKPEKVNILAAADYIKSCPDEKFILRGYADKQTATPERNEVLAVNRANAVKDCLVNEFGVNPDQLIVESYGGVDYMFFEEEQCSRSVIIMSQN